MKTASVRVKPLAIVAAVLVGSLVLLLITHTSAISRQMHAWKLLPEPERLTELYFTDHSKLPNAYLPGEQQTVGFTIHNLEYRTVRYHYTIVQADAAGTATQQLAAGDITLKQNEFAHPSLPITLVDTGDQSHIIVTLAGQHESISYLIARRG